MHISLSLKPEKDIIEKMNCSKTTYQIEPINVKYVDIKDALLNMCHHADECVGFDIKYVNYGKYLKSIDGLAREDNTEPDLYFYHSDHIGSSSFITDRTEIASQHLQYLPFGEPTEGSSRIPLNYNTFYEQLFVEQRSTANYYTPYKFSGKEKDEETSYSYFGARYYMNDVSVWLSVDPLKEKYPYQSPYTYCGWNPVMIIDPDGRSEGEPDVFINKGETVKSNPDTQKAFDDFQARNPNLKLNLDPTTGQITTNTEPYDLVDDPFTGGVILIGDANLTSDELYLKDAIDNHQVFVNIITDNSSSQSAGSYYGTIYYSNHTAESTNKINL